MLKYTVKIAATIAVTTMIGLVASPALAAPRSLPAGESLYVFGCEDGTEPAVGIVDVATGAVTEVVPGITGQCFSSPAYNPVDGKIYVIDWTNDSDLAVFDPQAKTLTTIDAFDCDPYTLAIDASGNALVWDYGTETLRPVNLENAACGTAIGFVFVGAYNYGMAFSPNGSLYAANYSTGEIGTINTSTAVFTQVGSSAMVIGDNAGLTFDSSGIAWVIDESDNAEVYSADITDYAGTDELSGQLTFNGVEYYSEAIGVGPTPKSELPNTGLDSIALGLLGLTALIAVGAGTVLIARRRAS